MSVKQLGFWTVLSGLIRFQTVFKVYQWATKPRLAGRERVNMPMIPKLMNHREIQIELPTRQFVIINTVYTVEKVHIWTTYS